MNLSIQNYEGSPENVKLACLKLYQWALDHNLKSYRMVVADGQYYNKSLEQRRDILSAPSINFLCKTIIFENTAYDEKFAGEFYPKYIAVMVQYVAKIHTQKLNKQIRILQQTNSEIKAAKQYFHFRLVDEKQSGQMTGYEHNAVTPALMNVKIPIVFSHEITNLTPQFFWMGGGHPWVKSRVSFEEFKQVYDDKVFVWDITY